MKMYNLSILLSTIILFVLGCGPLFAEAQKSEPSINKRIRHSAVAGSWYPGKPEQLAAYIDGLLAEAKTSSNPQASAPIRALVLPHAGYQYSGATAAVGIKRVLGKKYSRVVVLGPAHKKMFAGLSIPDASHYETPLGLVPIDQKAVNNLLKLPTFNMIPGAHNREHSIEMELPLLQQALQPGWQLVPILVGRLDEAGFAEVAEQIRPLLDADTLLVVSGDFTHYGDNFDYKPFANDEHIADNLKGLDMGALQLIVAGDAAGFIKYRNKTGITACGFGPLAILANLLPAKANVELLQYATSGQLTGDFKNSVSYLTVAVTANGPFSGGNGVFEQELSKSEMLLLHKMAKKALALAVEKGPAAVSADAIAAEYNIPATFRRPSGAFVTLKKEGDLRGCIGFIKPIKPLYQAVVENAVNAALRDHRFRAVGVAELPELEVEVSVLSKMHPVDSYKEFEVGRHGVVLSKDGRGAVFLPEVATEQGWSREETLSYLARKAGLPADAWKQDASFELFTSQKFSLPYREKPLY